MKLHTLFTPQRCVCSFEIFPPKQDAAVDALTDSIAQLARLGPDYISITYGAGGSDNRNLTAELASRVKAEGVEPLAHLTCMGNTRASIDAILDELAARGIENVLALRGDRRPGLASCPEFSPASDLAAYLRADGRFNVVGACYPEGHFESDSPLSDIRNLKKKVDAGVTHLNSQLFFDNEDFYRFLERARLAGIEVPIQAGIMPIVKKKQVERIISLSGVKIPAKLSRQLAKFGDSDEAMMDAGIAYATDQIADLAAFGVDGVHLYLMNNVTVAARICANLAGILRR